MSNSAVVWVASKPLLHKLTFLHLFAQRLKLSQVVQHGLSCQESLWGWTLPSAQRILSLLIVSYTWLVSTSQFQHWMNVEEFIVPPLNLWIYAFSLYLTFKSIKRHSWTQRVCWIPTISHTLHKIRQIIFLWLVIQSFILGCIPKRLAEEACLPVNMTNWSC